ncbi:MAG: hypothetical protein NTZ19_09765 [Bacteroidetes bacterium]|nr:hypothetical protein [Bacteroidota bacterium]
MKAITQYFYTGKEGVNKTVLNNPIYFKIIFLSGLNVLMNFLLNLILPSKIGIAAYGDYRYLYSLIGFAGLFHLGYLDGFYLTSLQEKNKEAASISYLSLLVLLVVGAVNYLLHLVGINFGVNAIILCSLFMVSNFVNQLAIYHNLNQSFLISISIQLIATVALLIAVNIPYLAEILAANINLSILVLLLFQMILLFVLNFGDQRPVRSILGFGSFSNIKKYHQKGFKTLAIGLIIMMMLGIDKVILKSHLSKETYGIYCFSNSFLISLIGLSLSISNKFVSELYEQEATNFKQNYNLLVKNVSVFSIFLILVSFNINLSGYTNLLLYVTPSLGLFSLLFIIQLLHSNLAKVHNLEFPFFAVYFGFICISCVILYFFNSDIHEMLLLTSIVFYIAIMLFDSLFIRVRCKFEISIQNKLIALLPILLEWVISYNK